MSLPFQTISKSLFRYNDYLDVMGDTSDTEVSDEDLQSDSMSSLNIGSIRNELIRGFVLFLEHNQIPITTRLINSEHQLEQFFQVLHNEEQWFRFKYRSLGNLFAREVVDSYEANFREIEEWFNRAKCLYDRMLSGSYQSLIEDDLESLLDVLETFSVIDSLQNCINAFHKDYIRACAEQLKKDLHIVRQYEGHFALSFFSPHLRFLTHSDVDTVESYIFIIKVFQKQLELLDLKQWERCVLPLYQGIEKVENAASMTDFCVEYYLKQYPYKLCADLKKIAVFEESDELKSLAQAVRYTNIVQQAMRQIAVVYENFHNVLQLSFDSKCSILAYSSLKGETLKKCWKGVVAIQYRLLVSLIKRQLGKSSTADISCNEVKLHIERLFSLEISENVHREAQNCIREHFSEYMLENVEYTFFGEYNNQPKLAFDMLLQSIEREFPV